MWNFEESIISFESRVHLSAKKGCICSQVEIVLLRLWWNIFLLTQQMHVPICIFKRWPYLGCVRQDWLSPFVYYSWRWWHVVTSSRWHCFIYLTKVPSFYFRDLSSWTSRRLNSLNAVRRFGFKWLVSFFSFSIDWCGHKRVQHRTLTGPLHCKLVYVLFLYECLFVASDFLFLRLLASLYLFAISDKLFSKWGSALNACA